MTWLTGWNYRKAITISNAGSALTDYQTLVTVDTASLITAVPSKMQSTCNDIRFISSDGSTLLNYWIESGPNTSSTKIWVKIPSILASPSTTTIYLYYGNSGASAASNVSNTFIREISDVFGAWDLNGDALDRSGKGNNGTLNGGMGYTIGRTGQAGNFDGSTGSVSGMLTGESGPAVSMSAWIKSTAVGSLAIMSNSGWWLLIMGRFEAGKAFTMFDGSSYGNNSSQDSTTSINTGNWVHVVGTTSGSVAKICVNGVEENSYAETFHAGADVFEIGANNGGSLFNGSIEDVRFYNHTLTASEVTDLASNAGYVTTNYLGKELVRKYASPEPAVSTIGTEEVPTGDLNISSTPITGASVYIDGNVTQSGVTPLIVTSFTPGTHTYRLTKTGYTEIPATNFTITSGQTTTISQAMFTVANIGATSMTITPSENPCRTGICTVLVSVTWTNSGQTAGSSNLSITISGGTPTITPSVYSSVSFAANGTIGDTIIETFTVSGLSTGTHSICPDPN